MPNTGIRFHRIAKSVVKTFGVFVHDSPSKNRGSSQNHGARVRPRTRSRISTRACSACGLPHRDVERLIAGTWPTEENADVNGICHSRTGRLRLLLPERAGRCLPRYSESPSIRWTTPRLAPKDKIRARPCRQPDHAVDGFICGTVLWQVRDRPGKCRPSAHWVAGNLPGQGARWLSDCLRADSACCSPA